MLVFNKHNLIQCLLNNRFPVYIFALECTATKVPSCMPTALLNLVSGKKKSVVQIYQTNYFPKKTTLISRMDNVMLCCLTIHPLLAIRRYSDFGTIFFSYQLKTLYHIMKTQIKQQLCYLLVIMKSCDVIVLHFINERLGISKVKFDDSYESHVETNSEQIQHDLASTKMSKSGLL